MLELNKIYNMDCLDGLRQIPSEYVDCIITDPPYGISYQSAWRTDRNERFEVIAGDGSPFIWWLYDAYRILKPNSCLVCFCRWDVQEAFKQAIEWAGFKLKSQVIWDRQVHGLGDLKAQFAPQHDVVWFAVKGKFEFPNGRPTSIVRVARVPADKLVHPTEKPIELMRFFVEKCSLPGSLVLDPFMGSGATARAAKDAGRQFIGFELNPDFCQVAENRLKQEVLISTN